MKIFSGITKFPPTFRSPVITIGVFDGVHRGHQKVIAATVRRARALRGTSIVMTFAPHPVHVLAPRRFCPLIISVPHRLQLLSRMGVDVCLLVPFTRCFARLSPEQFIRRYLVNRLRVREVIVGEDFHFGRGQTGTAAGFRDLGRRAGFRVRLVRVTSGREKTVSSSRIRRDIAAGDLSRAARLLGRPFSVLGRVVHGDSRGRRLGYPTANLHPRNRILPPSGVYIVSVLIGRRSYPAIANVGHRPSFKRIGPVFIEVHLFDFRRDLYGREVLVRFCRKIRDERVFRSEEDLVRQIRIDETRARRWFAS